MGGGDHPAEVGVAGAVLTEQREVVTVVERDLRAGDRPRERLQRLGHLHGAVQPVVVGQRKRLMSLLGRRGGQLNRVRCPVQEQAE